MTMPSRWLIAQYWLRKGGFDLCEDTPMCFACRWFGARNATTPISTQWETSGLERCHLVPASEGGTAFPCNLVLLCKRCHRAAPMVGSSAEPMIRWIQRRQHWYVTLQENILKECRAIDPTLPEAFCALPFSLDEKILAMNAAAKVLKVGYHPGGDMAATLAQVWNCIVQFQRQIELALKEKASAPPFTRESRPQIKTANSNAESCASTANAAAGSSAENTSTPAIRVRRPRGQS